MTPTGASISQTSRINGITNTHTHIMPVDVAVPVIAVSYYKVLQARRVFYRSVVVREASGGGMCKFWVQQSDVSFKQ